MRAFFVYALVLFSSHNQISAEGLNNYSPIKNSFLHLKKVFANI